MLWESPLAFVNHKAKLKFYRMTSCSSDCNINMLGISYLKKSILWASLTIIGIWIKTIFAGKRECTGEYKFVRAEAGDRNGNPVIIFS